MNSIRIKSLMLFVFFIPLCCATLDMKVAPKYLRKNTELLVEAKEASGVKVFVHKTIDKRRDKTVGGTYDDGKLVCKYILENDIVEIVYQAVKTEIKALGFALVEAESEADAIIKSELLELSATFTAGDPEGSLGSSASIKVTALTKKGFEKYTAKNVSMGFHDSIPKVEQNDIEKALESSLQSVILDIFSKKELQSSIGAAKE